MTARNAAAAKPSPSNTTATDRDYIPWPQAQLALRQRFRMAYHLATSTALSRHLRRSERGAVARGGRGLPLPPKTITLRFGNVTPEPTPIFCIGASDLEIFIILADPGVSVW